MIPTPDEDHNVNTLRNRRWLLALLLLLLLGSGLVIYLWPDQKLAAAKSMRQELFSPTARTLSSEERQKKWRTLREAEKQLSPAQRRELSSEMRKRMQAKMASYSKMSKSEKNRVLDEQIKRMQGSGFGGGQSGGRGGNNPAQGQGGTDGGTRGGSSTAERDERRRERLDSTTPAERAMAAQFFRDLAARRSQLGLPASGGPGR